MRLNPFILKCWQNRMLIIDGKNVILQLFQAEMFSRQQILHSIISDGQRMLEQGQVDDR